MQRIPRDKTIIVVPCYNEAARLPKQSYLDFVRRVPDFGFLFVDDGSTDQTFQLLNDLKLKEPTLCEVLKLEHNSGKAEAVRQGFLSVMNESRAEYVAFWDADLATPLDQLPGFMAVFQDYPQVEMVLGARVKLMGRSINRHIHRHYLGRLFATCVSLAINLKVYDTQCGAKVFRTTETLKKIFSGPFKSKWIFDVEILARYMKEKRVSSAEAEKLIYELPLLNWHDVAGSKLKPQDYFLALKELVGIYLNNR